MHPQSTEQQAATVRVAFDINAGVDPQTFPADATTAQITDRLREAFLAADVIRDGHEFAVVIEGGEMGVGTVKVLADGDVIEHGSITREKPEQPTRVIKARYLTTDMTVLIHGTPRTPSAVLRYADDTVLVHVDGGDGPYPYGVEEGVTVVETTRYMSCPRNCGVDLRKHNSSGLIDGGCDTDARDRFIAGLRAAADFYEANPTMPLPLYPDLVVHAEGDDQAQVEQVRAAAELLGVEPKTTGRRGHFRADRYFGPIQVGVLHIPAATMADHAARQSYAPNIKAEGGTR